MSAASLITGVVTGILAVIALVVLMIVVVILRSYRGKQVHGIVRDVPNITERGDSSPCIPPCKCM